MQGVYVVEVDVATVTTAQLLLGINCPAAETMHLLSVSVTCTQEDTSEQFQCGISRATGPATGGAANFDAESLSQSGAVLTNAAWSVPTGQTGLTQLCGRGANKLGGWERVFLPESRPKILAADAFIIETLTDISVSSTLNVEAIIMVL